MIKKITFTIISYILAETFITIVLVFSLNSFYSRDISSELLLPNNINGALILYLCQTLFLLIYFKLINNVFFNNDVFYKSLKFNPLLLCIGILSGLLIISIISTILVSFNFQTYKLNNLAPSLDYLTKGLIFTLFISIKEEVIFRGFILNSLNALYGKAKSIIITSILFSLIHFTSNDYDFFVFTEIFLMGILLSLAMFQKRNIWLPIGIHTGYNFFLLFIYRIDNLDMASIPFLIGEISVGKNLISSIELLLIFMVTIIFLYTQKKHLLQRIMRYWSINKFSNKPRV